MKPLIISIDSIWTVFSVVLIFQVWNRFLRERDSCVLYQTPHTVDQQQKRRPVCHHPTVGPRLSPRPFCSVTSCFSREVSAVKVQFCRGWSQTTYRLSHRDISIEKLKNNHYLPTKSICLDFNASIVSLVVSSLFPAGSVLSLCKSRMTLKHRGGQWRPPSVLARWLNESEIFYGFWFFHKTADNWDPYSWIRTWTPRKQRVQCTA